MDTTRLARAATAALLLWGIAAVARAETFDVTRKLPHDSWSEGLDFADDGALWSPYPHSIRVLDPGSGAIQAIYDPPTSYQESVTWFQGKLWALSYADNSIYAGEFGTTGKILWTLMGATPDVHGWGITHDDHFLIMTGNGKPFLYFMDPATMTLVKTVTTPVNDLEDVAWDGKYVWASSYSAYPGTEMRLDPDTGDIVDLYQLPEPSECMKLDGVAILDGEIYVTGKDCPFIYVANLPAN